MAYLPDATLAYYSSTEEKGRTIVYTVDVARTLFEKMRGRMFTQSIPTDYALLFPFTTERETSLHMTFVPYDLGAIWVSDNIVQKTTIMNAWTGRAKGSGDIIIEAHPEVVQQVSKGDYLFLQGEHNISQLEKPESVPTSPQY